MPDISDTEFGAGLFSADYRGARSRFLEECRRAGFVVDIRGHPLSGLDEEPLAMDVVLVGPADAGSIVVVTSATHGVEGFGGSAIQLALMRDTKLHDTLTDTAILLIHAVNPYGFSWLRRVNEDNVDLNRNFVDHASGSYPENDLFELLYPYAVPREWNSRAIAECDAAIEALARRHGAVEVRKALARGQYRHPDSIHFGGNAPSWSSTTLAAVCEDYLARARRAVLVDLHTGLGPYGHGELMTPARPGEAVYDRLHAWFDGEVHSTTAGTSAYAGAKGSILAGFRPACVGLEWTAVGLEFGTRDWSTVSLAIRADAWLHAHGDPQGALGAPIRRQVRDAFHVDEARWKRLVCQRGREVVGRLVAALSG